MKEFPTWNSVVTSHIASHVKIKSIRCIECCLDFASKESLMSHLHCRHSELPKGICIDVSIANNERQHLQCKTDLLPESETLLCSEVLSTENQKDSSARMRHIENVIRNENFADKNKAGVTGADSVNRCDITAETDVEPNSKIYLEQSNNSSMFQTDNIVKSSTDFSSSKTCKRKSRKPTHVVVTDVGFPENTHDCIEIVAATQPMMARCPHCTFTCNTDLQLKV